MGGSLIVVFGLCGFLGGQSGKEGEGMDFLLSPELLVVEGRGEVEAVENMLPDLQGRVEVMEGKDFSSGVRFESCRLRLRLRLGLRGGGGIRKVGWSRVRQGRGFIAALFAGWGGFCPAGGGEADGE